MWERLKGLWRKSWTIQLALTKAATGAVLIAVDEAIPFLGDANVQGYIHQYVPDAKWGLVLLGISLLTYVSAEHHKHDHHGGA